MKYEFTSGVSLISPFNSYDYFLIFKNGTVKGNLNLGQYVQNKEMIDYTMANNSRTLVNEYGSYYGYCYISGGYHWLCFNTQVTYIAFADRTNNSTSYLDCWRWNNGELNDYNSQLKSPSLNVNISGFGGTYVDMYGIDMIGNTNTNIFSAIFDYRLASDSNTYYLRGEDYFQYTSCFRIDNEYDDIINLAFGYDNTVDSAYNRGLEIGSANGRVNGYDDGYRTGYNDGVAVGKVSNGSYGDSFDLIGGAFNALSSVSSIEVLPNITLGTCISIPIIISLIVAIFKIVRG